MTLAEQIDSLIKDAMRAKDSAKLSTLRLLKSAVKYATIEKHGADATPTDEEVIAVIRKEVKKRADSIESFTQAGRADAAATEAAEKSFLESLLPAPFDPAALEQLVRQAITETGATSKAQMGLVMKAASAKAAGRADGKTLSALVQKLLPA